MFCAWGDSRGDHRIGMCPLCGQTIVCVSVCECVCIGSLIIFYIPKDDLG